MRSNRGDLTRDFDLLEGRDPDASDRLAKLCESANAAQPFHSLVCAQIEVRIGPGEPLDMILEDSFAREKFNLAPRKI